MVRSVSEAVWIAGSAFLCLHTTLAPGTPSLAGVSGEVVIGGLVTGPIDGFFCIIDG